MGIEAAGVTVMIPTLNAMPFVSDALESVLQQTHSNLEVIIVDASSEDGTLEYVQDMAARDNRVRLLHQEGYGIAGARNLALGQAKFDWMACLDSDDVAAQEWLAAQLHFLGSLTSSVFVACNLEYVDTAGRSTGIRKRHLLRDYPHYNPLNDGCVPNQGCVYLKTAARSIGGYRSLPQGEDYDFFLRLSEDNHLTLNPDFLVRTRILRSGLTIKGFEVQRTCWMYAKDCAMSRRRGLPEPPFIEWLSVNQVRISGKHRSWAAQRMLTLAGAEFTDGRPLVGVSRALRAAVLSPSLVARKALTYRWRPW